MISTLFLTYLQSRTSLLRQSLSVLRILRFESDYTVTETLHDFEDSDYNEEVNKKRNKSQLQSRHYEILHQLPPNLDGYDGQVRSLSFQRRLYAKYGRASGINVSHLWPSTEELEYKKEYEKVAFPHSFHEMVNIVQKENLEKEANIMKRQNEIAKNVAQLGDWMERVQKRKQKLEEEALQAKLRKEKIIEEVRQMLGFHVDPKDARFKEALEKKEEEEKKAAKKVRKLEKQRKLLERAQKLEELKKLMQNEMEDSEEEKLMGQQIVPVLDNEAGRS